MEREDYPERLLNVQTAAHEARKHHSREDVLVAAGMDRNPRIDRERILGKLIVRWNLKHDDDIQCARRTIDEILSLADL